jgi:hypothetical protein
MGLLDVLKEWISECIPACHRQGVTQTAARCKVLSTFDGHGMGFGVMQCPVIGAHSMHDGSHHTGGIGYIPRDLVITVQTARQAPSPRAFLEHFFDQAISIGSLDEHHGASPWCDSAQNIHSPLRRYDRLMADV